MHLSSPSETQGLPATRMEEDAKGIDEHVPANGDAQTFIYDHPYAPASCSCEDIDNYRPGGYHPIEIADWLTENFQIIHKLGAGGSATVWLARDQTAERYVAIKVMTAVHSETSGKQELAAYRHLQDRLPNADKYIVPLYDSFEVEGPNGKHLCIVLGLCGPSLQSIATWETPMKLRNDIAQSLSRQVTEGLEALHQTGVIYSDVSTNNILLRITDDIHTWSIEELCERLGCPMAHEIELCQATQEFRVKHAPAYVYPAIDFAQDSAVPYLKPEARLIDFAEVQLLEEKPEEDTSYGVTMSYADPESILFGERHTQATDTWALACIIFELRSGDVLHGATGNPNDVRTSMIKSIGPMPQDWRDRILAAAREEGLRIVDKHEEDEASRKPTIARVPEEKLQRRLRNSKFASKISAAILKIGLMFSSLKKSRAIPHSAPVEDPVSSPQFPPPQEEIRYRSTQIGLSFEPKSLEDTVVNIGTWTPWCHMTIEQRMAKLTEFHHV